MKRRILLVVSILLVFVGLALLVVPRVSNQVGKQIAHSTIEDFKSLKSEATADEVTDEMPSEENTTNQNSQKNSSFVSHIDDETELTEEEYNGQTVKPNFTRLYMDSVIYNEALKQHQAELLINEQAYQKPSLNLSSYGIDNGVYGYVSAPSIGMELPIYLGGNDDNMALGAAHMTYTSLPIGGESTNCVLSGHSGYIGRIFFDYLPNLNIGDEIVVENYWNTLTYQVTRKQINKSYESADCFITDGKDLLTLITCISDGHGGFDRFYVIAERS